MQVQRSHVTIAIVVSLVVAASVFVQQQLARNNDRAETAQATQARGKGDVPIVPSTGPQMLLNNPDGVEFERTIVTDAPFSATMIIETSERLPDGSLTTKATTSRIYRDSKGRTRRDWLPETPSTTAEPIRSVIHDVVAGFTFNLDHRATSAQRTILVRPRTRNSADVEAEVKQAAGRSQMLPVPSTIGMGNALQPGTKKNPPANQPESLGSQNIEGILAEGTRLKVTLPAGRAGNDSPMEISVERWYAPGLQAIILVRRTDSRTGETTYRLTDIDRNEPPAQLFTVPSKYKLTDQTGRDIMKSQKAP